MVRCAPLASLVLLWGCTQTASPGVWQEAIVGGTTDTGDTSVVMMLASTATEYHLCSGEVISPHVVLTAAHCVDPALNGTSAKYQVFLGDDYDHAEAIPSNFMAVTSTDFDQAFDPDNAQNGHDIGVIVTTDVIPRTPLPVNQSALAESAVHSAVRVIGYGVTAPEAADASTTTSGVKRQVSTTISSIAADIVYLGDMTHGVCNGDSGGPTLLKINGTETIIGVSSFTDKTCTFGGAATEVDAYWASFIEPHVVAAETGAAVVTPDLATAPVDMTAPVTTSATTTPPSAGQTGEACTDGSQCASSLCTSKSYCTQTCTPSDPTTCPDTMNCEVTSGAAYCLLPTKGGCSATPGRGSGSGLLGGLLLLGLALWRRQRLA